MANETISQLPSATTPLTGAELMELVQSATSVKTAILNILTSRLVAIPQFIAATGAYTANAFDSIVVDTSSAAFTITLPPTPSFGQIVWFLDAAGTWNVNNLTVSGNGQKILGQVTNLAATTARDNFSLVYYNTVQGWILGD